MTFEMLLDPAVLGGTGGGGATLYALIRLLKREFARVELAIKANADALAVLQKESNDRAAVAESDRERAAKDHAAEMRHLVDALRTQVGDLVE